MITFGKGTPDSRDDQTLRQDIFDSGIKELEWWKIAIKTDQRLFDRVFQFIFSNDRRLSWRACWIIDSTSEQFPEILEGKLPVIIRSLLTTADGSLKRHFTRILCRYPVPELFLAETIDRCFDLLGPSEAPAVRVNAMQLLYNISQELPDLKGELSSVIENLMEEGGSAGFMNRSEKLLRKLRTQ